jgi:hypothetical protein
MRGMVGEKNIDGVVTGIIGKRRIIDAVVREILGKRRIIDAVVREIIGGVVTVILGEGVEMIGKEKEMIGTEIIIPPLSNSSHQLHQDGIDGGASLYHTLCV